MSLPWVEKYRPKIRSDLKGNDIEINSLYAFLKRWKKGISKPGILLIGAPGTGKTSAVLAIANDLNFEIVEVNASDSRNKKSVKQMVGKSTKSVNYFTSKRRLILVDEVDGLAGNSDRGGLNELIKIFKTSNYPIICTANDPESDKIKKIKKELRVLEFNRLDEFDIFELLEKISINEKIVISEEEIENIAKNSNGDLRAAINDLESFTLKHNDIVSNRDKMQSMTDMLNNIYMAKSVDEISATLSNSPSNYKFLLNHLFDETDKQCSDPYEINKAYEQIALADLTLSRIMKKQDWSLLKYFFLHLSTGLFISRNSRKYNKIEFIPEYPKFARLIGIRKRKENSITNIAISIAPKLHLSRNRFIKDYSDYFLKIINSDVGAEIAASLDVDDEIIRYINKLIFRKNLLKEFELAKKKIQSVRIKSSFKIKSEPFKLDPYLTKTMDKNPTIEKVKSSEKNIHVLDKIEKSQSSLDDFF